MTSKQYVVGFLRGTDGTVLLVRKERPAWQHGRLNGIGGKIEPGETPLVAMLREWTEEVGGPEHRWRQFCRIRGGDYDVFFFAADYIAPLSAGPFPDYNDVGERHEIIDLASIGQRDDLIQNLKWLLPLAFYDKSMPRGDIWDMGVVDEAA